MTCCCAKKDGGCLLQQRKQIPLRPGVVVDITPIICELEADAEPVEHFLRLYLPFNMRLLVAGKPVLTRHIPAGFAWDGASRPWWASWLIPRVGSQVTLAALVHDVLYRDQRIDRALSDAIFRDLLRVPRWRAWTAWAGVRLGGWRAWKQRAAQLDTRRQYP